MSAGVSHLSGGAQMVELASDKFVCIVDESKLVDGLGGSKGGRVHFPARVPCTPCPLAGDSIRLDTAGCCKHHKNTVKAWVRP